MNKTRRVEFSLVCVALFWGSFWGISEATLGHLLHKLGIPGLAGVVMFPLGFYFMARAYMITSRRMSIFLTALIAAGLKWADLLLPATSLSSVLNPSLAILFESMAVILFLPGKSWIEGRAGFIRLLALNMSWRVFYVLFLLGPTLAFPFENVLLLGPGRGIYFFALEGVLSACVMTFFFKRSFYSRNDYSSLPRLLSQGGFALFVFLGAFLLKIWI